MTRLALALPALLALALPALADPFPARGPGHVTDLADILPAAEETALDERLAAAQAETGVEVAVLTIPTRAGYDASPSLAAFATGIFNAWGIGDAARNDGILVLVAAEDREMRVALGSGYDQGYDVLAEDIISRVFLPELRDGRLAEGLLRGTDEVIGRIARRHAAALPPEALPAAPGGIPPWAPFAAVAALIGGLAYFRRNRRQEGARTPGAERACPNCGRAGMTEVPEVRDGRRVIRRTCRHCAHVEERDERPRGPQAAAERDDGRGRGGGQSSGGGAGGRW